MSGTLFGRTFRLQPGLWANSEFLKLWAAQTISFLGSQITFLALPLTATITLQATPAQMGLLRVADAVPALIFGLFAGALIDRLRRRPILIITDIGRALLLATIPIAAYLGVLSMGHLYVVAFLGGILTLFFDVAHMSLLPSLIQPDQLVEGNSKLETSRSIAKIAGPGIAGLLVQLFSASVALLLDAFSFIASAFFLFALRAPETTPTRAAARPTLLQDVVEGFHSLWGQGFLRTMALSLCVYNLFNNMLMTVYLLYVVNELHLAPATLGLIYTLGSIGFALGAVLAGRAAKHFGIGPTIVWGAAICDAAFLLIPLAYGQSALPLLIGAQFISTFAGPITAINQLSLRQAITPDHLLGRVNATMRVIALAAAPLGALMAALLGDALGLRPTLLIGAIGIQFGFVILLLSPIRALRQPPTGAQTTISPFRR